MKIGMLTSGGDCQGLNSALRGVAKTLYNELGSKVTIYGIRDGYRGLIEGDYHEMNPRDFSDILTVGGTILGTSRQPFKEMQKASEDSEETKLQKMLLKLLSTRLKTKLTEMKKLQTQSVLNSKSTLMMKEYMTLY